MSQLNQGGLPNGVRDFRARDIAVAANKIAGLQIHHASGLKIVVCTRAGHGQVLCASQALDSETANATKRRQKLHETDLTHQSNRQWISDAYSVIMGRARGD